MKLEVSWKGERIFEEARKAALLGLRQAGELILRESLRAAPVETGALRESARLTDNGQDAAAVSYDTPYALAQHEALGGRGSPKYLENPGRENAEKAGELLGESLRRGVKGK